MTSLSRLVGKASMTSERAFPLLLHTFSLVIELAVPRPPLLISGAESNI